MLIEENLNANTVKKAPTELYSCEHILGTFQALLNDVNFDNDINKLGVTRFQFILKRNLNSELCYIYVGLWYLALLNSFPQDANRIFESFLDLYTYGKPDLQAKKVSDRILLYRDILNYQKEQDFTKISEHILSFTKIDQAKQKAAILRLNLSLRQHYKFIFEHLV